MEPDCAFYVGDRARGYSRALREGEAAADAFVEQTPPDLVVKIEITNADADKAERCADLGCGRCGGCTDGRAHVNSKPSSSP